MVMVYLTDKRIPFNREFIKRLDLMIERVEQPHPKLDACFQNEGLMGTGKTTQSCAQGYYISYVTGRPFSEKNVFLDAKKALDFAKKTEKQIIIYDEPAFIGLKSNWRNSMQQDLIILLMTARKKRHFTIFNFVRFYKFNEFIAVDAPLGMAHTYERRDTKGFAFGYIPRQFLESLYNDAIKKHLRNYFKYTLFTGEFADVLNPNCRYNILDVFDIEDYEKEKDRMIASIGNTEKKEINKDKFKLMELKKKIGSLKPPILNMNELAKSIGITKTMLYNWRKMEIPKEAIDEFDGSDIN